MNNITASNTAELLESSARLHKFFWNGLFVALYEPIREQHSVVNLLTQSSDDDKYYIPTTESTLKNYLSCKTRMDSKCFKEFCKGIQVDVRNMSFMEIIPYVNRAFAYLDEQDFSGKASRSKTYRRKTFNETDALMDEGYLWNQALKQDEKEKEQILETFNSLSPKELSILYRVVDGYSFTCECDDTFMECYCCLNEKGQAIFREALEVEQKEMKISYHDEFCNFCREMAEVNSPAVEDITPGMLYEKMESVKYSFCPEDAESLTKYRYAEPKIWQVLELFHKVIQSYPEENIKGMSFSESTGLLVFLRWLAFIPSLCK